MTATMKRRDWKPGEAMIDQRAPDMGAHEAALCEKILAECPELNMVSVTITVRAHSFMGLPPDDGGKKATRKKKETR